jgi:hypothetical protein
VLEELRKLGSFKGQGFLYGQPQDAQTVRAALAAEDLLVGDHDHADAAPAQDRAANG